MEQIDTRKVVREVISVEIVTVFISSWFDITMQDENIVACKCVIYPVQLETILDLDLV